MIKYVVASILIACLWGCQPSDSPAVSSELSPPKPSANEALLKHQKRFTEAKMINVGDNIHVAYGYDMCNIIFVEGPDGLIVIDTGFSVNNANKAIAAMREISDKPIKAVFYTHGHGDHVGGSAAFRAAAPEADFYAHPVWQENVNYVTSAIRPAYTLRAFAQLGFILPEGLEGTVGSGGGPVLRLGGKQSYIAPTKVTKDSKPMEIAGLRFQVLHTPGDMADGISLWFPEFDTVLTGDVAAASHVHVILSTPRHEPGRNAQTYVDSLSRLEALNAGTLIGGHGDVVSGREAVRKLLRNDRRTAQYIIDQVTRYIRENRTGDFVQANLTYPDWILGDEERADYYHKLSWISRGVYAQFMGWFSGDATSLAPLPPDSRAARIVDGFGGAEKALVRLKQAYSNKDFHWAAELATFILTTDPQNTQARQIKSWSLKAIAYGSESANERNYLLTQSMMLDGKLSKEMIAQAVSRAGLPQSYGAADPKGFLHTLGTRLDSEAAKSTNISMAIKIPESGSTLYAEIDRGVLLTTTARPDNIDFTMTISHDDLARACEGLADWTRLETAGTLSIIGNKEKFLEMASLF